MRRGARLSVLYINDPQLRIPQGLNTTGVPLIFGTHVFLATTFVSHRDTGP